VRVLTNVFPLRSKTFVAVRSA